MFFLQVYPRVEGKATPPTLKKNKALLTCGADVRPRGTLKWEKNKIVLCDNCGHPKITTTWKASSVESTLEFTVNTSTLYTYGDYVCIVGNTLGNASKTITLKNVAGELILCQTVELVDSCFSRCQR